jgi:hypothetical protein
VALTSPGSAPVPSSDSYGLRLEKLFAINPAISRLHRVIRDRPLPADGDKRDSAPDDKPNGFELC